jgi:hypothetical protein
MDPLSVSAAVAGFLSIAIQITEILKGYIDGVHAAPEEARSLFTEVAALCQVLQDLVKLLRGKDLRGLVFNQASQLLVAIKVCQGRLEQLYTKLEKLQVDSCSSSRLNELYARMKWPVQREDYQSTLTELQRFVQTVQFALVVSNWLVLPDFQLTLQILPAF